jgi:hypothetical protein
MILVLFCFSIDCHSSRRKNLAPEPPNWMKKQIQEDLRYYKNKKIPLKKMDKFFQKHADEWLLVKFEIDDGNVLLETNIDPDHFIFHRISSY